MSLALVRREIVGGKIDIKEDRLPWQYSA